MLLDLKWTTKTENHQESIYVYESLKKIGTVHRAKKIRIKIVITHNLFVVELRKKVYYQTATETAKPLKVWAFEKENDWLAFSPSHAIQQT